MAGWNRVMFAGNLTRDPEKPRYTPEGSAVLDFCIAVNEKRRGETETLFLECTAFGKTAESCAEYLEKGREILVEGRLVIEKWIKGGEQRSKIKVLCNGVKFFGRGNRERGNERESADEIDF
jgi:single-strand DNA-binding protein